MRLKLLLYNFQDLFLRLAYPLSPADLGRLSEAEWQLLAPHDEPIKPLFKLRGLAQAILAERPDIVLGCEVGGEESLANFSRLFLADAYQALATPPLSRRGIETGFLVHRDLGTLAGGGWRTSLHSHADVALNFLYPHEVDPQGHEVTGMIAATLDLGKPEERRLSRDIPELRFYSPGASTPAFALLVAHLKSAFDPDGIDPQGSVRRAAEVQALLKIVATSQQQLGASVPFIVAGDFNGRAARLMTAPEFAPIYAETDWEDVLELAGKEPHERITHVTYFFDQGHASQLDYIFLPRALQARLDPAATYVYRYRFAPNAPTDAEERKASDGDEMQMPGSMRDRRLLPSDHYPVVCVVDMPEPSAPVPEAAPSA